MPASTRMSAHRGGANASPRLWCAILHPACRRSFEALRRHEADARAHHPSICTRRELHPPMKKLRTLVVVHSSLVPPESLEGYTEKQIDEWRTEYDVISALRAAGHEVQTLGVLDSLTELRAALIGLEAGGGVQSARGIQWHRHLRSARGRVPRAMRAPYTGCNPRGLLLSRDKVLCKQLLAFHRIPTPQFAVFRRGQRFTVPRRLRPPLFVKSPPRMPRSASPRPRWWRIPRKLRERVQFMHEQIGSDALVEEYIEGRELYVGVLGNERLTRLPVWEMRFGSLPDSLPAIATRKVKWDRAYQRTLRHHHPRRRGAAAGGAAAARPAVAPHLPRAAPVGLRAHRFSRARRRRACSCSRPMPIRTCTAKRTSPSPRALPGLRYRELLERIMAAGLQLPRRMARISWVTQSQPARGRCFACLLWAGAASTLSGCKPPTQRRRSSRSSGSRAGSPAATTKRAARGGVRASKQPAHERSHCHRCRSTRHMGGETAFYRARDNGGRSATGAGAAHLALRSDQGKDRSADVVRDLKEPRRWRERMADPEHSRVDAAR